VTIQVSAAEEPTMLWLFLNPSPRMCLYDDTTKKFKTLEGGGLPPFSNIRDFSDLF